MSRRVAFSLVVLFTAVLSARALTVLLFSETEIVHQSDRIVLGTVTDTRVAWLDPDGDGRSDIYTVATFQVEDVLKGNDQKGQLLSLNSRGGTLGGITQSVPGVPTFAKGERLLLCLEPDAEHRLLSPIFGVCQGRWSVRTDENGVDQATRSLGDVSVVSQDPSGALVPATPPPRKEEPLADVLARIRREVQQ